jgi:hypothetical protein
MESSGVLVALGVKRRGAQSVVETVGRLRGSDSSRQSEQESLDTEVREITSECSLWLLKCVSGNQMQTNNQSATTWGAMRFENLCFLQVETIG